MKPRKQSKVIKWLAHLFLGVVVMLVLLISACRFLLPSIGEKKSTIEQFLSQQLGTPVEISLIKADWWDLYPTITLEKLNLLDYDQETIIANIDKAQVSIRPFRTLISRRPEFGPIIISGLNLSIIEIVPQTYRIEGMGSDFVINNKNQTQAKSPLLAWILAQKSVTIKDSPLFWQSHNSDITPLFIDSLTIRHGASEHILSGSAHLVQPDIASFDFVLHLNDAIETNFASLKANWFIAGNNIKLPNKLSRRFQQFKISNGDLNFKSWGSIANGFLEKSQTQIELQDFEFSYVELEHLSRINTVQLQIDSFTNSKQQPVIHIQHPSFKFDDSPWSDGQYEIQLSSFLNFEPTKLALDNFSAQKATSLLTYLPSQYSTLKATWEAITPSGILQNTLIHFKPDMNFYTEINNIEWARSTTLPGIKTGDAEVVGDTENFVAFFNESKTVYDAPRAFREPLNFETVSGFIECEIEQDHFGFKANDLKLSTKRGFFHTDIKLTQEKTRLTELFLITKLDNLSGVNLRRYFPKKALSDNLNQWLKNSVEKLTVSHGALLIHDPTEIPDLLPPRREIVANAQLNDLFLKFSPRWPSIEKGTGTLSIRDNKLAILLDNAETSKVLAENISGTIPNLSAPSPQLEVSAQLFGDSKHALEYINQSPLQDSLNTSDVSTHLSGSFELPLALSIPLKQGDSTRYRGKASLRNNHLTLANIGLQLNELNGDLHFNESEIYAKDIQGLLLHEPVSIDIQTVSSQAKKVIQLKTSGSVVIENLLNQWSNPILNKLSGKTQYTALLSVKKDNQQNTILDLDIESDLQGVSIELPKPIRKLPETPLRFKAKLVSSPSKQDRLNISHGDALKIAIEWHRKDDLLKLDGLDIAFNQSQFPDDKLNGITVRGNVNNVNLSDWINFFQPTQPSSTPSDFKQSFSFVKLNFSDSTFYSLPLNETTVELEPKLEGWQANVSGKYIVGKIHVPDNQQKQPISLDLDYLNLNLSDNNSTSIIEKSVINPSTIPPISITAEQLIYNEIDIGQANITLAPQPGGNRLSTNLSIKHLSTNSVFDATVDWTVLNNVSSSHIEGALKTENLGALLSHWGNNPGLEEGKTEVLINGDWLGNPAEVSLGVFRGDLNINVSDGRLIELSPGASRIFGLLSLNAIKRRLSLDFSDLYKKGLSFDTIKGTFRLDKGNAYTCDTRLTSPSTNIQVKGRTGLINKDYDQIASVAMHLTDPIPYIIGVINPIAGVATWVGKKLVEKTIEDYTGLDYKISGPWSKPSIEALAPPKALTPWKILPDVLPSPLNGKALPDYKNYGC